MELDDYFTWVDETHDYYCPIEAQIVGELEEFERERENNRD